MSVRGFETQLVLAGGYDERLSENVEYLQELKRWGRGGGEIMRRVSRDLGLSA